MKFIKIPIVVFLCFHFEGLFSIFAFLMVGPKFFFRDCFKGVL